MKPVEIEVQWATSAGDFIPFTCLPSSFHGKKVVVLTGEQFEDDYMCPNCNTPWKCNGPHIPEAVSGTLESLAAQLVAEFPMAAIVRAFNNAAPGMGAALTGKSAAPDLLSALSRLLAAMQCPVDADIEGSDAQEEARAAIAKATK